MIQLFINRERELAFLEDKYQDPRPQLIIIYGRRRIGKTELIKRFIEDKSSIYFLCTRDSINENIKAFRKKLYEYTGDELFLKLDNFIDIFKLLVRDIGDERIVIAIDEFSYLIELDKGIISVFQKIWDETLSKSRIFLLLLGSSVSMMETEVLNYRSPLYGRRTGEWRVTPISFIDIRKFYRKYEINDVCKLWFIAGGVPYYFLTFNGYSSIDKWVKEKILSKGEVLYNEPKYILKEETREDRTYIVILKYLSQGYNTFGKLANITGIEKANLSKYLSTLENLGLIKHILPLDRRRGGIYIINDNYFNFWFRFVYPNMSDLEIGLIDEVYSDIQKSLNQYNGEMFERLIERLVKEKFIPLPKFNMVRKWWWRDKEIDLVLLNDKNNTITFLEVKWTLFKTLKEIYRLFDKLRDKAMYVEWRKGKRSEYFGLISRAIPEDIKAQLRDEGYIIYDLKDIDHMIMKEKR